MRLRRFLLFLLLLSALASAAPQSQNFSGKWYWHGAENWQQLTLELTAEGTKVNGTLFLGPGLGVSDPSVKISPDEYWKFFFEPLLIPIKNAKILGNRLTFEQPVNFNGAKNSMKYSGVIEDGRIAFTREYETLAREHGREWDLLRTGNHKVEFVMVRAGKPRE